MRIRVVIFMLLCGFVCFAPAEMRAQIDFAQTLYAPVMQAGSAGTLGVALSNPSQSPITLIATARTYTGETIVGGGITNPQIVTLAPLSQRASTASELFGQGMEGRAGWISFQSPSTLPSGLFVLYDNNLTNVDGGELVNGGQTRLVFPKVVAAPGRTSHVSFTNTSSVSFDVIVTIYSNLGVVITKVNQTLAPYSGFSGPVTNLVPPGLNFTGFITIESLVTFPRALVGLVINSNGADSSVLLAQSITGGALLGHIPHLAIGGGFAGGYASSLSFLNMDLVDQMVRVTAVLTSTGGTDTLTVDRLIPAKTRLEEDVATMFSIGSGSTVSGYIRFEVLTEDTTGVFAHVEFSASNGILLSAVPAQSAPFTEFYFSHIADGLGFYTGLALLNPNAESIPVAIDIIDRNGVRVSGVVIVLAGGERRARLMTELIPGTQQVGGYVRVSSNRDFFALELFGSSNFVRFAANVGGRGSPILPRVSGGFPLSVTGGLVVSADGRVSQLVPPGALDSDTSIQLAAVDPSTFPKPLPDQRLVSVVEALPHGANFKIPTRLAFPLGLQLPPGTQVPLYYQSPITNFRFQPSGFVAVVDETGRNAVATVTHFTNFGVVWPDSGSVDITSISPQQGTVGARVTIRGTGFEPAIALNTVTFAGPDNTALPGIVETASATAIDVIVPFGAVTGDIQLRSGSKQAKGVRFVSTTPTPGPAVTSISPASISSVPLFSSVLIRGTGFTQESTVTVGGAVSPAIYLGPTTMRVEFYGPLTPGLYPVVVRNPFPGGGPSNSINLLIQ